jgi:PhoH-like ATPase
MGSSEQVKTFVIDTNVLIHNPEAILSFRDNEIVIPLWVLEELDKLKTYPDQRGKSAREAIRFLDASSRKGNLKAGVRLENGSTLRVAFSHSCEVPEDLPIDKTDNKILMTAYSLQREGKRVFFVSKDINARVKATALGIHPVDYEKQKVDLSKLYEGVREIDSSQDTIDALEAEGSIEWKERLYPNEYVLLKDKQSGRRTLARFRASSGRLESIAGNPAVACGVRAANERQRVAFDLLLDDSVSLVTLLGKAGTGKTLLAIACGLKRILEDKRYSRMLVTRPVVPLGKEIGFLPGEKAAKMANWMQPIFDNLEYILSVYKKQNFKSVEQLVKEKLIEIEAVSFIRGRSLPNQYIVIDEAQNLTPHEIKTIVSRAGEDSKVVLTGDPYQIDNIYLDASSNGLTYLVDAFKAQELAGHVSLKRSERSPLAELAAELL